LLFDFYNKNKRGYTLFAYMQPIIVEVTDRQGEQLLYEDYTKKLVRDDAVYKRIAALADFIGIVCGDTQKEFIEEGLENAQSSDQIIAVMSVKTLEKYESLKKLIPHGFDEAFCTLMRKVHDEKAGQDKTNEFVDIKSNFIKSIKDETVVFEIDEDNYETIKTITATAIKGMREDLKGKFKNNPCFDSVNEQLMDTNWGKDEPYLDGFMVNDIEYAAACGEYTHVKLKEDMLEGDQHATARTAAIKVINRNRKVYCCLMAFRTVIDFEEDEYSTTSILESVCGGIRDANTDNELAALLKKHTSLQKDTDANLKKRYEAFLKVNDYVSKVDGTFRIIEGATNDDIANLTKAVKEVKSSASGAASSGCNW